MHTPDSSLTWVFSATYLDCNLHTLCFAEDLQIPAEDLCDK